MKPTRIPAFAGINNRAPLDRLPTTEGGARSVRDAVNVDLTQAGSFQTRQGFEQILANGCRSLFTVDGSAALAAVGAELVMFDGVGTTKLADLSSAYSSLSYANTPMGVVWSDGARFGMVRDWVSSDLAPSVPNPTPVVLASQGGSLEAGAYGICFATVLPDGRRSAFTVPVYVDVPAGGRIEASGGGQQVVAYVTAVNGDVFYRAGKLASGSLSIGVSKQNSEPVAYEHLEGLPVGRVLGYRDGRLLSALGNMLYFSMPFQYGLTNPATNFVQFPSGIRVIADLDGGLIVGTADSHWIIRGDLSSPESMRQIAPYGAVEGTVSELPNSESLMWFTSRGPVMASPDGSLSMLQDQNIQFPSAATGAAVFQEQDGMRKFLASLSKPVPSGSAVARSFMDARVIE